MQLDPAPQLYHLGQRTGHHAPRSVATRMDYARHGMRAFVAQDQPAVPTIEARAQVFEFADASRSLLHQDAHRRLIAEPHPSFQGVSHVQLCGIARTHGRRDATLGKEGGGLI